jgi:hypothetical protein
MHKRPLGSPTRGPFDSRLTPTLIPNGIQDVCARAPSIRSAADCCMARVKCP